MTHDFLAKDLDTKLKQVQEYMYQRLQRDRDYIDKYGVDIQSEERYYAGYDRAVKDEILFLEKLIDQMERS